jgi:hypothetical protein
MPLTRCCLTSSIRAPMKESMRGLAFPIAIMLPLLFVGACSSDEDLSAGAGYKRASASSSILAKAYADPTTDIGMWKISRSPAGTRIWYGNPNCPWPGS